MARGKLKLNTFKERLELVSDYKELLMQANDPMVARELGFELNYKCQECNVRHKDFSKMQKCIIRKLLSLKGNSFSVRLGTSYALRSLLRKKV